MLAKKQKPSERLNDTIIEMATALYDIKAIDGITLREIESLNIPKVNDLTSKEIKMIRLKEKMSQSIFAKFLNITVHTIREWEQGKKHPRGTSLKLLNMVLKKGIGILAG